MDDDQPGEDKDDGFAQFVSEVRPGLRRHAYLLCGDWHEAEDLVQSTLLAVLLHWDRLHWPEAARGYARTTLYRTFLGERRHARWTAETPRAELPELGADAEIEAVAERLALVAALRELPARQRAAVMLRYLEDLDVARTAQILECAPATVRSQTTRALATMRATLSKLG